MPETKDITYKRRDGSSVPSLLEPLVQLYASVYAEPPYCEGPEQVDRFRNALPDDAHRQGFVLITAGSDTELAGAAYGWTMAAGKWWSNSDTPPPENVIETDKLAVMEWMVSPRRRGLGIGRTLILHLLEDRPERYATLASDPRSAARMIYRKAGWREVGQTKLSWGPPMDLLLLDL